MMGVDVETVSFMGLPMGAITKNQDGTLVDVMDSPRNTIWVMVSMGVVMDWIFCIYTVEEKAYVYCMYARHHPYRVMAGDAYEMGDGKGDDLYSHEYGCGYGSLNGDGSSPKRWVR
jgi:hypothetical protein